MSQTIITMNEWAATLAAMALDDLPERGGRELVLDATRQLTIQAEGGLTRHNCSSHST